jgi:hypothetical protein
MKTFMMRHVLLAAALAVGTGVSWAQTSSQDSSSTRDPNAAAQSADARVNYEPIAQSDDKVSGTPFGEGVGRYISLLSSDHRVFELGTGPRHLLLYGATVTEAYDDHFGATPDQLGSRLTIVSPMIGISGNLQTAQYLLQYSPTVSKASNPGLGLQAIHNTRFFLQSELNHGWSWTLGVQNQYGVDQLRFLAPLDFTTIQNIPIANATATVLALGNQRILNQSQDLSVYWQESERNRFNVTGQFVYYGLPDLGKKTTYIDFSGGMKHTFSPKVSAGVSGHIGKDLSPLTCNLYGAAASVDLDPTRRLSFKFGGGPDFGSPLCSTQQGFNFGASMVARLTERSDFYLAAARRLNTPFQATLRAQSEDTASAGYSRRFRRGVELRLDTGYVHIFDRSAGSVMDLYGDFIAPQVGWQLSRSITLRGTYRHIYQILNVATVSNVGRNQVMLTLEWTPAPKGILR